MFKVSPLGPGRGKGRQFPLCSWSGIFFFSFLSELYSFSLECSFASFLFFAMLVGGLGCAIVLGLRSEQVCGVNQK